jgi:hypothetical protein
LLVFNQFYFVSACWKRTKVVKIANMEYNDRPALCSRNSRW